MEDELLLILKLQLLPQMECECCSTLATSAARRKEEAQVIYSEPGKGASITTNGAVKDELLLVLQAQDALFDSVLDDESHGMDGLVLAHAVRAVNRLHLGSRVPPGVLFVKE